MPYDDVQKFSEAAVNKAKLLKEQPGKYFLRSVMAGFFIVVAMIFSNVVGNVFQGSDPAWGKLLGGIVFAIAVLLIVFIGAELFTGNNLVMAFGAFDKKVSWTQVGKVWLVSYIGNFVGCLILSVIFVLAGASGTADYYAGFIGNKLSIPVGEMFFRAILCNFFVCLAVACGMKCKNEVAKFFMIIRCCRFRTLHCQYGNLRYRRTSRSGRHLSYRRAEKYGNCNYRKYDRRRTAPCLAASNDECR